jgi:fermentation-respiration switch protein FrsA (DUF1100 family)
VGKYHEDLHRVKSKPGRVGGLHARNTPERDDSSHQLDHAEVVSGRWLVKAILIVLAVAGIALYLTVCLLFYQGQWQFVFFPPKTAQPNAATIAANNGLPITEVRFDTSEEGVQRLDGWFIPSALSSSAPLSQFVVLFCPDGHTDLPGNVEALKAIHALGVNVFAFDYQGFGNSQAGHPSQQRAYASGVAALNYLTGLRHIPPDHIVLYGARLGAAVSARVGQHSPKVAGLILEDPQPSLTKEIKHEQHIHLLPLWLVFQDRFDISGIVPSLKMPKLILSSPAMRPYAGGAGKVFDDAPQPKEKATLTGASNQSLYRMSQWRTAVGEFLDSLANRQSHQDASHPTLK